MLRNFHSYLDSFCASTQQSWQEGAEESHAILELHGFPLNFFYLEKRGLLFIQAGVGVPPEESATRERFWKNLLKANNAFSETGGGTLGYDEASDTVTFQISWPLEGLNQESFSNLLENTIELLAQWLQKLGHMEQNANDVGAVAISEHADEFLQYQTMMRV